ncbi:MAG: sensor histidine kinase [Spirochaetaceae bacterium]|nr:sensor histidine kinase [Spirochaetaceae bacterium]
MLYGLAFLSMKFVITRSGFGIHELGQVALTLTAMTLLMVIFHLIPNLLVQSASLFLQFLGGLFLGILVGPFVWLKTLWVIPLIIQFGLVMDLIVFFPLSMFVTLSHFNESAEIVAWGRSLPDPITRDRLVAAAVTIAAVLIVGAVRYLYNRLREQENLVENLKTNILKLTRANYDFQRYAADTEEITMKKERLRISREIHDTVGYTMTTLRMMLEAGTDLISESPLKLEVQLRKALEIVNRGHHDIRVSLRELRERESDRPRGLKGLKSLIDLFSETTGVSVRPEWGNIPWLFPDDVEAVLYRFVQEGMSNALSHGNATEIDIHFRMDDDDIIVVLSDDGVGADVLIEGLGLHGMRERIENCGGSFEARNSRQGFFLQARLPLKEGEIGEDPAVDC